MGSPFVTAAALDDELSNRLSLLSSQIRQLQGSNWRVIGDPGEPAFQGAWANGANPARFRVEGRRCWLSGRIQGGVLGTVAFTMPFEVDLPANVPFAVDAAGGYGNVVVTPAGDVVPTVGSTLAVTLDGISFPIRV